MKPFSKKKKKGLWNPYSKSKNLILEKIKNKVEGVYERELM